MRDGVGSWKTYGVRGGASERDESARGPGQSPARSDCMCCKVRGSRGGGKGKGEICGRRQLWRNGRETSKWQGSLQRQGQALAAAAAAAGPWKLWSCWYGTVTVQYARLSCLQRYLSFWPFHSPADGNPAQGKAEAPMPCLRPALDWWDVRWTWTSTLTLRGDPQGKAHDFASHRATRPHRSPSPHTTPPPLPPDEWGLVPAGGARGRYRVLQGFALPPESRFQRRQIPCAATSPVLTRYRSPKTLFINLTPSCSPSRSTSTLLQPRRASARSDAGDADVHFDMDMAVCSLPWPSASLPLRDGTSGPDACLCWLCAHVELDGAMAEKWKTRGATETPWPAGSKASIHLTLRQSRDPAGSLRSAVNQNWRWAHFYPAHPSQGWAKI